MVINRMCITINVRREVVLLTENRSDNSVKLLHNGALRKQATATYPSAEASLRTVQSNTSDRRSLSD